MRQVSIVIFLLTVGCSNQREAYEQTSTDTVNIQSELIQMDQVDNLVKPKELTDTISNGASIKFFELTDNSFDSLQRLSKLTYIPLKSFDKKITILDNCKTFKLSNGKVDSLCNMNDGEYYERYSIKGLWGEMNLLLANFENWEESHDFLINLIDGGHYLLTPSYEVSPKLDIIISYVDISDAPIYSSELLITKIQKGTLTTLLQRGLGQTSITDVSWISNTDCLISTGFVDFETDNIKNKKKYLIKIE
jgi:hypothetical protein